MATTPPKHVRIAGGQQGQLVNTAEEVYPPDLGQPLINEPAQGPPPGNPPLITGDAVGPLQYLIGTWTNRNIGTSLRGGPENPFSYNLMVLPQESGADPTSPYGYILKSMSYYEEITFSPIHGTAANRSGAGSQISNALLYEQRVYISGGPAEDLLVHFENGIWGYLTPMAQALGPYGNGNQPGLGTQMFGTAPPEQEFVLFKQISVPHGNSVLACGFAEGGQGAPTIGPPPAVLPVGVNTDIYRPPATVENLNPDYALNPNLPLSEALALSDVLHYVQLNVDTELGGGGVTNIASEQTSADVTRYYASYWIEDVGAGGFTQLQYSQTIMLNIPLIVNGQTSYVSFPHITTNTLTKVS